MPRTVKAPSHDRNWHPVTPSATAAARSRIPRLIQGANHSNDRRLTTISGEIISYDQHRIAVENLIHLGQQSSEHYQSSEDRGAEEHD
jgi:hypothetical protein